MSAQFSVQYRSPQGFICELTIEGDSGKELMPAAEATLTWLVQHGCTPVDTPATPQPANGSSPNLCAIHNVKMKKYTGKNGSSWYSHRLEDGSWCNGK